MSRGSRRDRCRFGRICRSGVAEKLRDGHPECVSSMGKTFKGRNCARKMAILFRYMEADLYNLYPAIGEVNGLRSNYSMVMIPGREA